MIPGLTHSQMEKFEKEGLLVVENFLSGEEVESLKDEMYKLVEGMDPTTEKGTFSTTDHEQCRDTYFLESADKIRYFFEQEAFDENGDLQMEKQKSLNKVGHALHFYNPIFKRISFSQKVKEVALSLDMKDPAVIQGMYIFKHPGIGGEVTPHQDGTFLYTEPLRLFGFWFPLDDATEENGCLWYVPGSHTFPITRRFLRTGGVGTQSLLEFRGQDKEFPEGGWVPAPVKKGSLVLIHGQVYHKSEKNVSNKPRPAYTFHVVETEGAFYASKNWLQPTPTYPLPKLYSAGESCIQKVSVGKKLSRN